MTGKYTDKFVQKIIEDLDLGFLIGNIRF